MLHAITLSLLDDAAVRIFSFLAMNHFFCSCGNELFFENTQCLVCHSEVGFFSDTRTMHVVGGETGMRRCANGTEYGVCNWVIAGDNPYIYCTACRLNLVVPDLSRPGNLELWGKMEAAKRRALHTILTYGLPVLQEEGDVCPPLLLKFLLPDPGCQVITGHEEGVITLNLLEADDAIREQNRKSLNEPYRTLLGHFRHELGHYYWSRWFEHDPAAEEVLPAFRELFGDERVDYGSALQAYYANGPEPDWQLSHISAYSTMHPWEDWAETWAHYLYIMDALETIKSFGLQMRKGRADQSIFSKDTAVLPPPFESKAPDELLVSLHRWANMSPAINELALSLGHDHLAPFVLSAPVVKKLHFVHCMIERQRAKSHQSKGQAATPKVQVPATGASTSSSASASASAAPVQPPAVTR